MDTSELIPGAIKRGILLRVHTLFVVHLRPAVENEKKSIYDGNDPQVYNIKTTKAVKMF